MMYVFLHNKFKKSIYQSFSNYLHVLIYFALQEILQIVSFVASK